MTFKPRTRTLLTTLVAFSFGIAVLGGVFHWARQLKTRAVEQKLAIVEDFLGGIDPDEINYGFHVVDGRVVFEGRNHGSAFILKKVLTPVNGADPKTFRDFGQQFPERGPRVYYCADASSIYVCSVGPIHTLFADPASFRLLDPDGRFACDDSKVFYFGIEIEGADADSFEYLQYLYAKDDQHVYHEDKLIEVADVSDT